MGCLTWTVRAHVLREHATLLHCMLAGGWRDSRDSRDPAQVADSAAHGPANAHRLHPSSSGQWSPLPPCRVLTPLPVSPGTTSGLVDGGPLQHQHCTGEDGVGGRRVWGEGFTQHRPARSGLGLAGGWQPGWASLSG
jgi:hypothetical protein